MQNLRIAVIALALSSLATSARAADPAVSPVSVSPASIAPAAERFMGPEIAKGQRFRVVDIPADSVWYAYREGTIGVSCTALDTMKSKTPGLFEGSMLCRKRKWVLQTVAVQLLAPGEAMDPPEVRYTGGSIRKYQKFRILDVAKKDEFRRDDLVGAVCVAPGELARLSPGWYGTRITCTGETSVVAGIAIELVDTPPPIIWAHLPPPFNPAKAKRYKGPSIPADTVFRIVETSAADAATFGMARGLVGRPCRAKDTMQAIEPGWFAGNAQCDGHYSDSLAWTRVAVEVVEPDATPIPARPEAAGPPVLFNGDVIPALTAIRVVETSRATLFVPRFGKACTTGPWPVPIILGVSPPSYGQYPFKAFCEGKEVSLSNIGVELIDARTGAPLPSTTPPSGIPAMSSKIPIGSKVRLVEISVSDPFRSRDEWDGTTCIARTALATTGGHYSGTLSCAGPNGTVEFLATAVVLDLLIDPPTLYKPASGRTVTRFTGAEIPMGQRFRVVEISASDVKGNSHLGKLVGGVCVPTRGAMRPSRQGPGLFSGSMLCNDSLNGFVEAIGVELVDARAQRETEEGYFDGKRMLAGQRFVVVDLGPDEKKDPKKTVLIGKHCIARGEMWSARAGRGFYGGEITCDGVLYAAQALRVWLEDTEARPTWSVILPPFKAEGPARFMGDTFPEGSSFRVIEASEADRAEHGVDRALVGLPCAARTMTAVEPGWWAGESSCGSAVGDSTTWKKVAIEIAVPPASIPPRPAGAPAAERFTGTRIHGLTAFRVIAVDPRDKAMSSRADAVGLACVSTVWHMEIDRTGEPLYEGRADCNGKREEFRAVAVELIDAATGAPLAIKAPPAGRPLADEAVPAGTRVRITSITIADAGIDAWGDWVGSTCVATTTLTALGNHYSGGVTCMGPYGSRTWKADQLTLEAEK